jgi:hypothetical protein
MAQQNIDYGSFPNDPSADAIRIAFEKVQTNFTELYGNLSNIAGNVSAVTAGTGILTSGSTGNVTINAIFSSLTAHSNTVIVSGLGGFVPTGGVVGRDYTVNNATNTLFIELDPTLSPIFDDLILTGNLIVDGETISSPDANIVLSNGNIILSNGKFSGNILSSAGANTVQFADTAGLITGDNNFIYDSANTILTLVGGNITTDTYTAGYLVNTVNLDVSNVANITNTATVGSLVSLGNISGVNGLLSGNLEVIGNIESTSMSATGNVDGGLFSGNGSGLFDLVASNITTGTLPAGVLAGTYNIDITGNADSATHVTGNLQPNINTLGTLVDLSVTGNTTVGNLLSLGLISGASGNFTGNLSTNQIAVNLNIAGNTATFSNTVQVGNLESSNNITSANIVNSLEIQTDTLIATGNISGNNLEAINQVSAGSLTITGNSSLANVIGDNFLVANLTSSGFIDAVEITVNQSTVAGNVIAGNVYANGGIVSGQTAQFSGQISAVNGIFTGNITSGNINTIEQIQTLDITVTGTATSQNIVNIDNITTNELNANIIDSNSASITTLVVSNIAEISIVQLSGLATDPSPPEPGQVYYNTVTGKFRVYNGVLNQWQSLN